VGGNEALAFAATAPSRSRGLWSRYRFRNFWSGTNQVVSWLGVERESVVTGMFQSRLQRTTDGGQLKSSQCSLSKSSSLLGRCKLTGFRRRVTDTTVSNGADVVTLDTRWSDGRTAVSGVSAAIVESMSAEFTSNDSVMGSCKL